ncbi:MAG: HAD-IC family P-type ATPase, partial [bacterium]
MAIKQNLWHSYNLDQVLADLKTSPAGLSFGEAKKRLKLYGLNKLPEEKTLSRVIIFLSQFKSPLVYILLIASGITFFLKEYTDTWVILAVVILNTMIGFFQESKANQAITKLKQMVEYKAVVIREGGSLEINVSQLVPGDIIVIESGDKIPADARLINVNNLQVVEAALTGESLPSTKKISRLSASLPIGDRENMVYLGTVADRGRGLAVVTATGAKSELGQVATLIKKTKEDQTPLQKRLARFSRLLGLIFLLISIFIFLEGLLRQKPFYEMLITSIAVAVAAIPEGLLVAVTVILALGMQAILKKNALVRRLIAAETLGSTTVICTDKTGTLTEGKMMVTEVISGFDRLARKTGQATEFKDQLVANKHHLKTLEIGLLCNDAVVVNYKEDLAKWQVLGDPTEKALLLAGAAGGLDQAFLTKQY